MVIAKTYDISLKIGTLASQTNDVALKSGLSDQEGLQEPPKTFQERWKRNLRAAGEAKK